LTLTADGQVYLDGESISVERITERLRALAQDSKPGLLGTIFGIIETFSALAAGGVSDPAAVSRGIGTALIATALGIATALIGLLGNNVLNRRAHVATEDFKGLLLALTP
jgi:hypothetical protein